MRYFAKITQDHWTLKNKVNKEARQVAMEIDNSLLNDDKALGEFLAIMSEKIHLVNENNPRCKALTLEIHGEHIGPVKPNKEVYLYVSGNFHMTIFPIKHEL